MSFASPAPLVLSIQSHVAYGHVGNSAAVFPLQRMGIEVIPVNTVQFSNHTGYGEFRGEVFSAIHIQEVIAGLRARGVLEHCSAILSGYLGDAGTGEVILDVANEIRRHQPKALYLCDPVMGDVGRGMFVRPGIPEFMKRRAVPHANIITPNQYEFEYLVGHSLVDTEDAIRAARQLLEQDNELQCVVITSLATPDVSEERLRTLAVKRDRAYYVEAPRISLEPLPNGMGDTFSAVFLGDYLQHGSISSALLHATGTLTELLQQTRAGSRDLPLVAAQTHLVAPSNHYTLQHIE
ncbi:Pyridoxal kinase PdxY [Halomonadaceae bacterium LMG 33818]|uniref:pyridoxal kinase PdxY n=1 Tax=Cernens ardua TaxID=3402176 RepID=UPI003EDCA42D